MNTKNLQPVAHSLAPFLKATRKALLTPVANLTYLLPCGLLSDGKESAYVFSGNETILGVLSLGNLWFDELAGLLHTNVITISEEEGGISINYILLLAAEETLDLYFERLNTLMEIDVK